MARKQASQGAIAQPKGSKKTFDDDDISDSEIFEAGPSRVSAQAQAQASYGASDDDSDDDSDEAPEAVGMNAAQAASIEQQKGAAR